MYIQLLAIDRLIIGGSVADVMWLAPNMRRCSPRETFVGLGGGTIPTTMGGCPDHPHHTGPGRDTLCTLRCRSDDETSATQCSVLLR